MQARGPGHPWPSRGETLRGYRVGAVDSLDVIRETRTGSQPLRRKAQMPATEQGDTYRVPGHAAPDVEHTAALRGPAAVG